MRLSLDKLIPQVHYTPTPPHPDRNYLYNFDVLTREGERVLFLRMNYAKMRAHNNGYELPKIEKNKFLPIAYETRNYIAERNLRVIKDFVNKTKLYGHEADELNGELHIVLMRAIDCFNVGSGCKFSTYLVRSLINHWSRRRGRKLDFNKDMMSLTCEPLEDGEAPLYSVEEVKRLYGFLDQLPERERDYITAYYGIGRKRENMKEIGARCGFTNTTVNNWIKRGLDQLLGNFIGFCPKPGLTPPSQS
jgi:RNA polymerase sigma factor (sigma-70 family)